MCKNGYVGQTFGLKEAFLPDIGYGQGYGQLLFNLGIVLNFQKIY